MMNDNRWDKETNGRKGDHVLFIDPNCQRKVLERRCDFHEIKNFGSRARDSNAGQVTNFSEHASNWDAAKILRVLGVETPQQD